MEIRTAHESEAELNTGRAVPHSHPMLTLGTRHLRNDNRLLSSFVHEQLHWILLARQPQALAAMRELQALFPEVPVGAPEGAVDRSSTYLHLLIGWLEWDALTRLVGAEEADAVMTFWSGDHYRWVYRTVLAQRDRLGEIIARHGRRCDDSMEGERRPTMPTKNGWKTCSRGHKYRGSARCPVCWKGAKGRRG